MDNRPNLRRINSDEIVNSLFNLIIESFFSPVCLNAGVSLVNNKSDSFRVPGITDEMKATIMSFFCGLAEIIIA